MWASERVACKRGSQWACCYLSVARGNVRCPNWKKSHRPSDDDVARNNAKTSFRDDRDVQEDRRNPCRDRNPALEDLCCGCSGRLDFRQQTRIISDFPITYSSQMVIGHTFFVTAYIYAQNVRLRI